MIKSDIPSEAEIIEAVFGHVVEPPFAVTIGRSTKWCSRSDEAPRFTIVFRGPASLRRMLRKPTFLNLGECFVDGEFEIEGDFRAALGLARKLMERKSSLGEKLLLGLKAFQLPRRATESIDAGPSEDRLAEGSHRRARSVNFHYDRPVEFWAPWLDQQLVYSCGYFHKEDDSLEAAQVQKLDYICRKLSVQPGERLLDLGCGWGAMIIHAAANYGANCVGITLSPKQASYAKERIEKEGLSSRCRVVVGDYQQYWLEEPFDKISSVGSVEHLSNSDLDTYFANTMRLLRPGGLFMNHGIAWPGNKPERALKDSFVERYIFPDGNLIPISDMLKMGEKHGWEVRDVECLREHYALTMKHWFERLRRNRGAVEAASDEKTYRAFCLFLAGFGYEFAYGLLTIYQTLFAKPGNGHVPLALTRRSWYQEMA